MLCRFLQPLPLGMTRRAYSVFSSKPGGGRYFNSAKPHKLAPATASANAAAKSKVRSDEVASSATPASPSEDVASNAMRQDDVHNTTPSSPQPSLFSMETSPVSAPRLPPHPTFSSHTYPLHQFFAFHRPLLTLPLPTSALFETPQASFDEPPLVENNLQQQLNEASDFSGEADADTARQLGRALAMNRVGGWIEWEETLARLGDRESIQALQDAAAEANIEMDSTRRKRRKKMSKHKLKKRRRLLRKKEGR